MTRVVAVCFAVLVTASCVRAGFLDVCRTDEDCPPGHRCHNDTCVSDVGLPCSANSECAGACIAGACASRASAGEKCDPGEDADCQAACICVSGRCRDDPCAPPGVGADASGRCLRTCKPAAEPDACASGACYYIAATGGDDASPGTEPAKPWASFAHAWSVMQPGDTLILLDGTFRTQLAPTVSGTAGAPITIRAQNDGKAIIDGELARQACRFVKISHLEVQGIHCRNHRAAAVNTGLLFVGEASDITVRRVTVQESNGSCPLVHVYRSTNVLVEDCAAWGASDGVFVSYGSQRVTFRRCWAEMPASSPAGGYGSGVALSRSSDCLVENCVVVLPGAGAPSYDASAFPVHGGGTEPSSNNQLLGNVTLDFLGRWSFTLASAGVRTEGNRFLNNVSINSGYGLFQRADADLVVERHTAVGTSHTCHSLRAASLVTYDSNFAIHGELTDSVFLGGETGFSLAEEAGILPTFTHSHNVLSKVTTPYGNGTSASPTEMVDTIEPTYDTATLGPGAYLVAPSNLESAGSTGGPIGAEVLYHYEGAKLTCVPLWPWPMEQRILAEHGVSVTWAVKGGLWQTLDGVYPR